MPAKTRTLGESPSHPHYNPATGQWDGQLPNPQVTDGLLPVAGILSQVPENWPSIIERDGFADVVGDLFNLSSTESAVFRRILFRSGSASQGCWESQENMARGLRLTSKTVRKALTRLLTDRLIHKIQVFHGGGKSDGYIPVTRVTESLDYSRKPPAPLPVATTEMECPLTQGVLVEPLPISVIEGSHSGSHYLQTEGTEELSNLHEIEESLKDLPAGDGLASQDTNLSEKNQIQHPFIPVATTEMDVAADIPECQDCGQPWTPDPIRHKKAIRRGMREFLCDACRDAQVRASPQAGQIEPLMGKGDVLPASPSL